MENLAHPYFNKTEKTFKNEQRSKDAAAKKRPITSGVGNINNYYEDISLQNCHPYFSTLYCTEVWRTILESGWNLWVWLVGVVSRRRVWLVGGINGYGYNV